MQCKDTQPHISHRYFTCVLLFNTPSTLNYSLSGVYKKKKEKKNHPPGLKGFPSVYNFFCCIAMQAHLLFSYVHIHVCFYWSVVLYVN